MRVNKTGRVFVFMAITEGKGLLGYRAMGAEKRKRRILAVDLALKVLEGWVEPALWRWRRATEERCRLGRFGEFGKQSPCGGRVCALCGCVCRGLGIRREKAGKAG